MPYYFEGMTGTEIFHYKFEVDQASSDINLVTSTAKTYNQVNSFGYTYLDATEKKLDLDNGKFPSTDLSFTFSIQFRFAALPVIGQNIRLFQRRAGNTNKLGFAISREASGKNGIVLELEAN